MDQEMNGFSSFDEEKLKEHDELLSLLGLDLKDLSEEADKLLTQMAEYKRVLNLRTMDPASVHGWYTDMLLERMELEPHILSLEQFIESADDEIAKEGRALENFKRNLTETKEKLNIAVDLSNFENKKRSNKVEIETYKEKLNKLETSLQKYHIPPEIYPENMKCLKEDLKETYEKRNQLKSEVDKINLVRSARKDLSALKFVNSK